MIKYLKTKKDAKIYNENKIFCEMAILNFSFLIDDYSFDKAELEMLGRELQISFSRGKIKIVIVYEIGILPEIVITGKDGKECDFEPKFFKNKNIRKKFKIHNEIQDVINEPNITSKNLISMLGVLWNKNVDEIKKEIDMYLNEMSTEMKRNMKDILSEN